MHRLVAIILVSGLVFGVDGTCSTPRPATMPSSSGPRPVHYPDDMDFLEDFRIAHYLHVAAELQRLDVDRRAERLREIARDPRRASEAYPLCRMLFVARDGQRFRAPMLGASSFVGETTAEDWPLEPIAIYKGVPILVVRGYVLAGEAEPAQAISG